MGPSCQRGNLWDFRNMPTGMTLSFGIAPATKWLAFKVQTDSSSPAVLGKPWRPA